MRLLRYVRALLLLPVFAYLALPTLQEAVNPLSAANQRQVYIPGVVVNVNDGPAQEVRALWVTRWDYSSAEDVRTIVRKAAETHFNVIWFQVRGNADAFYHSNVEPWAARLSGELGRDPGWDPLAIAIEEAHARGLELHAYVNVFPAWLGTTPPAHTAPEAMYNEFNALYDNLWVLWDSGGTPMGLRASDYLFANPAYPPVADHIAAVVQDLVTHYAVDGVHLDYVRYAGPQYSYDPKSNAAYEEARQQVPGLERGDWQRQQITNLVGRLQGILRAARPGAWLSAAVWPAYIDQWDWWASADGYSGYYQDSVGWLNGGQIQAIAPMLYTSNILYDPVGVQATSRAELSGLLNTPSRYQILADDFLSRAPGRWVLPGIYGDYTTFEPLADRIRWAREAGAVGHAIFSYSLLQKRQYWDELLNGPYKERATVPPH